MRAKRFYRLLPALVLLLLVSCGSTPDAEVSLLPDNSGQPTTSAGVDWENTVVYNGTTYRRRTDLKTILFLGVDDTQTVQAEGAVVGNNGRADAIMLFLLDEKSGVAQTLAVSRDTITEVDIYKGNGDFAYSGQMQINMQYAFGNSARRSCFLMKRTVSELLYNIDIDGCLAMTMEGISVIVDELGGITLTMPEDYTEIDARYRAGAEVTLSGAEAERFVRYRDVTEHGSNEKRVERQSWFIHSLFRQIKAQGNLTSTMERLLTAADPYTESDLDMEALKALTNCTLADETFKVPGSSEAGEFHDEYYVDEEALQALVIQLFYEPAA